jgi:hypothetical protein
MAERVGIVMSKGCIRAPDNPTTRKGLDHKKAAVGTLGDGHMGVLAS